MPLSSLSLKNNTSQGLILKELDRLEASINEALHVSSRPVGGFIHSETRQSDARISRNLQRLAKAAREFHTSASSTATSSWGDGSNASCQSYPDAGSLFGDFSISRRTRVEQFLKSNANSMPEIPAIQPTASLERPNSPFRILPIDVVDRSVGDSNPIPQDYDDDDQYLEREFLTGLRQLATESIRKTDYAKAIGFLKAAESQSITTGGQPHEYRQIQTQLALCYFFAGTMEVGRARGKSPCSIKG